VKLTPEQFKQLQATEGGGENGGYKLSEIQCDAYDGRKIKAFAFENRVKSSTAFLPSKRYMGLLISGAKEFNMDEKYIQELESIPTCNTSTFKKIIAFLFFSPIIFIVLAIFGAVFTAKKCGFPNVSAGPVVIHLAKLLWFIEANFLSIFMGNGGRWKRD
jgi:hypothetical protein